MANVTWKGEAVRERYGLCRSHTVSGRHVARLSPIGPDDCRLFQAVLHGEHLVRGLRNGDLTALLYPKTPRDDEELGRRCARTSRAVAKLRGHGLLAKIPRSYRYRITPRGARLMSAAIRVTPGPLSQRVAGRLNGRLDQQSDCEEKFRERSKSSSQIL